MPRLNKRQLKKARKKHINDIIENANVEIFVELLANQLKNLSKQEIDMNIENAKNVIETHNVFAQATAEYIVNPTAENLAKMTEANKAVQAAKL
ncbi:hypothetical protein [Escherichia phage PSD2001]|nr:hypothetical protein [Escherichia phage PSD2001]